MLEFFHFEGSSLKLLRKFLDLGILLFNELLISRDSSCSSWCMWVFLKFLFQLLVLSSDGFQFFGVASHIIFTLFGLLLFLSKLYNLVVTNLKIFPTLCVLSNGLHPPDHLLMSFLIFPHSLNLFQILLINVLIFLPEVVVTILLTVILQTGLCNAMIELR